MQCPFCSETLAQLPQLGPRPLISACQACLNPVLLSPDGPAWKCAPPRGVQDIRLIAQEGSVGEDLMKALPEAIEALPILPEIATRILTLIRNPEAATIELAELINQDQVIAMKVLRLANSPVYGGLTEIRDLRAACARLGMRVVANTVQAIANGRIYVARNPKFKTMMSDLWRHALASAYCANEVATSIAAPYADILFVAGLIHDVGKVLLLDLVANRDTAAMNAVRESPELLEEITASYHTLIGLNIVRRWNLPPEFGITTFCHDRIEAIPADSWLVAVHTVALASAIANVSGFGNPEENISLPNLPSTKFLGLTDIKLASLRIDLEDKLEPLFEITSAA